MLTRDENERLTRVGPGTPTGELLRQYWIPVTYSEELDRDGAPYRVRLLGEDLIAFRDSAGRPGLLANHCPHRGASLFFGRNEEGGLRCVYHGWKFDISGACVDMPNEPPESTFKHKVRATVYPCREAGGILWAYMGPRAQPPDLPALEWLTLSQEHHRHAWRAIRECNWVQAMEGDLDTAHAPFLHAVLRKRSTQVYQNTDKAPRLEVLETPYGLMYGSRRDEGNEHYYWRSTQYLMPFFTCFPGNLDGEIPCHMWVPVDDESTMVWLEAWRPLRPFTPEERDGYPPLGAGLNELYRPNNNVVGFKAPVGGRPYNGWWSVHNMDDDFGLDRAVQRAETFTGIPTIPLQDGGMTVSMGRIVDRTKERLGSTDAMIIQVRRRLLRAAKALAEEGEPPPGVDAPLLYTVRSGQAVFPRDVNWVEAMREWHEARGGLPALDVSGRVSEEVSEEGRKEMRA